LIKSKNLAKNKWKKSNNFIILELKDYKAKHLINKMFVKKDKVVYKK
jgi:hypothetical protein